MFHTVRWRTDWRLDSRARVVIPWRGFRCFTQQTASPFGVANCIRVVIPWRGFRCFTPFRNDVSIYKRVLVVIPWRGFRCFTLRRRSRVHSGVPRMVVIPWRGFRCFTRGDARARRRVGVERVVIPWRGFRCFTRSMSTRLRFTASTICCNPLAGI